MRYEIFKAFRTNSFVFLKEQKCSFLVDLAVFLSDLSRRSRKTSRIPQDSSQLPIVTRVR
jgi:hypothetical protein